MKGDLARGLMIPTRELKMLQQCCRDAWTLGHAGRPAEGLLILDLGLTWAETPELDHHTGVWGVLEPWSAELATLYRRALVRYAEEFPSAEQGDAVLELWLSAENGETA